MPGRLDLVSQREHGVGVTGEDPEVGVPVPRNQLSVANGSEERAVFEPVQDAVVGKQFVCESDQLQQVLGAAVRPEIPLAPVPELALPCRRRAPRTCGCETIMTGRR